MIERDHRLQERYCGSIHFLNASWIAIRDSKPLL